MGKQRVHIFCHACGATWTMEPGAGCLPDGDDNCLKCGAIVPSGHDYDCAKEPRDDECGRVGSKRKW